MGYRKPFQQPPVRPEQCSHAYTMKYDPDRCWCDSCGQTWRWSEGWTPVPLSQAKFGEQRHK